ncbi:MAG TPA: hypothetical protein VFY17_11065 [Pilimelia sp.]|nr:hypothetical protein [Pilimelia sp.]
MTASARRRPAAFLVSSAVAKVYLGLVLLAAAYPAAVWTLGTTRSTGWEHVWLVALTFPGQLVGMLLPSDFTSSGGGIFTVAAIGALIVLTVVGAITRAGTRHRARSRRP